ncbi:putative outer membrane protein precursor [compost metagenome]
MLNLALNRLSVDDLKLDMQVPQTVLASASYDLDAQWKLLTSLGWQQWSKFGEIGVEVDANNAGTSITADRQYKDTWHASFGAQYQASPKVRWSMGVGFDSSMVDDRDRTVDNPAGDTWRFATGVNYQVDEGLDLHLVYTLIWVGDIDVDQSKARSGTTVSGTYENTALHAIGGGAVWRF